jgi:hypothetical protein
MPERTPTREHQLTTVVDNRGGARKRVPDSTPVSGREANGATITVRVQLSTQQRGTRKIVITPTGEQPRLPQAPRIDGALIKAIARAYRWNRMLEHGDYTSVTELAKAENVTESYLARILRLTLLSPKVVEAALEGRSGLPELQQFVRPFSLNWHRQETDWLSSGGAVCRISRSRRTRRALTA